MTLHQEDTVISRIVDGRADPEDWAALREMASTDPGVLERLEQAQRRDALLRDAVEDALTAADDAELPVEHSGSVFNFRLRLRQWSGWAVAAALAWLTAAGIVDDPAPAGSTAGWTGPNSAEEALDQYRLMGLAEGRVLGELPKQMLETRTSQDGARIEVTYIRRILERTTVTEVLAPAVPMDRGAELMPASLETGGGEAL